MQGTRPEKVSNRVLLKEDAERPDNRTQTEREIKEDKNHRRDTSTETSTDMLAGEKRRKGGL